VAHPKELSWITKSKKKNDRVDSIKLAKLHLVGMIPESHLLDEEGRIFRDLLIQRVKLGRSISSMKNSIIGYLKREGIFDNLPESNDNFSVKRRKAMKEIRFNNQKDLVLTTMLDRLEFFEKQIIPLEMEIKRSAKESEDVKLLMSIPGIDYYLASLLSSYIGDVSRFETSDRLASFFGIITSTKDSSTIKRRGHMSKEGAQTARWALSLAVDTVMMRNKPIREYYDSVKNRKGSGKFAHVSTMRKLIRMIFTMLKERKEWKYENPALTENKFSKLEEA
jgi:transposase